MRRVRSPRLGLLRRQVRLQPPPLRLRQITSSHPIYMGSQIRNVLRLQRRPSGSGMLVAAPADGMVFQYGEGMMAPIGSFSTYRRAAVGLLALDLSPREVAAGRYAAPVRHLRAGHMIWCWPGPRRASRSACRCACRRRQRRRYCRIPPCAWNWPG